MSLLAMPTILIAEDEPFIRLAAVDAFESAGFAVADSRDAAGAIDVLRARAGVMLLFTDIDMPGGMDGIALAHFVRKQWPLVQILVTSGASGIDRSKLPAGVQFFAKPYRTELVVDAASALLA
jgi:CheY-like chemotaxis protein